ncbi:hypothetical protein [Alteromonas sp. a30]|uniref:hypothetical protein n=1 Tax=Alteromonas sp. a30 TaxID=2730917 RepID=UPI0022828877|nr:hypothetical protein [Alteromonas sp. a30]MCY7293803.1 hypothetical protein [Alteromonas sp. a30]
MAKKIKLSAIVLFALVSASPAQAVDFDWFQSLFGVGESTVDFGPGGGGHPGVDPSANPTVLGPGLGGGHPGVDPVISTTVYGPGGGGDPGVDPD